MIKEIKDAAEARNALRRGSWLYWAPGDATKYRVALIRAAPALAMYEHLLPPHVEGEVMESFPHPILMLVIQVADGLLRRDSLVINAPDSFNLWNPVRWVERGFPPGWWAGVRPLLAELLWTDREYSGSKFRHDDNAVFAKLGLVS
jgi:hypothetical protein